MKLMKELLEAKTIPGDCVVVYNDEHASSYYAASAVFSVFGYNDVGTLDDFITQEEANDYADEMPLEEVGVWSSTKKPTKADVIKSLDSIGVIVLSGG